MAVLGRRGSQQGREGEMSRERQGETEETQREGKVVASGDEVILEGSEGDSRRRLILVPCSVDLQESDREAEGRRDDGCGDVARRRRRRGRR